MPRHAIGWIVSLASCVALSAILSAAWQQPPLDKPDPADPLLESIKQRMGALPRLVPEDPAQPNDAKSSKKASRTSPKHRAAEWMLKSARLLESQAEPTDGQLQVASQLRKQVLVLLSEDGNGR